MPHPISIARTLGVAVLAAVSLGVQAQSAPVNSTLDGPHFYELLLAELDLRQGDAASAYARMLAVARRTRDEALFKRAVEVAWQARAGDEALAAARAWRLALPESAEAIRYELRVLGALNRGAAMAEPLKTLLARTPATERAALIANLPRVAARGGDLKQTAAQFEELLRPYAEHSATRTAARLAAARLWWQAGDAERALALAQRAQADEPAATAPALLAIEMLPGTPAAEALAKTYLARADADVAVRLAYVRALSSAQRYVEARDQLTIVTRAQPELPGPWLTLGALQIELREPRAAQASLQRHLQAAAAAPAGASTPPDDDDDDDASGNAATGPEAARTQAHLMLAQAAEMQGDLQGAAAWLAKVDDTQQALDVQLRRATLLARQGKLREARTLLQQSPERRPEDARAKLIAESQLLREVKRWPDAHAVLVAANQRWPDDVDLLYEQAMLDEKLGRLDDMERVLRRVMEIKPDHHHAYNALGYSLAERNLRLPEARSLVMKALELAPGDPFITDSVGWIEFRLGNPEKALAYLQRAYAARPDAEIAAHLGEVLWVLGQKDEARRIWREGRERDRDNETLRETLTRLQVRL
ncbi:MAG TPA: tetratricopeptide repeat protein [Burkholderiaceae bacterium]|nr:tetratricopeptide repeat protein [Burkholderiaceae bacterium]